MRDFIDFIMDLGWVVGSIVVILAALILFVITGCCIRAAKDAQFVKDAPGRTYQSIVMQIGPPTGRESFPDGTEVAVWSAYHPATTTYIQSGKVLVPVQNGPYTTGWRAIFRDGRCIKMEDL